jgi:anti-sigma B factor antagonist
MLAPAPPNGPPDAPAQMRRIDPMAVRRDLTLFEVRVEHLSDHDLVRVVGDLDVYTTNQVRDLMSDPTVWRQPLLVLDLSAVAFLDSTGLSALVASRRLARSRGAELRLVCPAGSALRVIRMTRLDAVLEVYASQEAALAG